MSYAAKCLDNPIAHNASPSTRLWGVQRYGISYIVKAETPNGE